MRRILQSQGVEVIHLGHNRSVDEVVDAAVQEDVHGVAVSSYQGGHNEYFRYLIDRLDARGAGHVKVFGGGGGVIIPSEIAALQAYGVSRIFSPEDGQTLGLPAMVNQLVADCDHDLADRVPADLTALMGGDHTALARVITAIEAGRLPETLLNELRATAAARAVPVLGITGTGGSGKSSLTDELIGRFRLDYEDKLSIAVIAVDPTRRKGGGALLGDRIRMNAIHGGSVYFRSLATRTATTVPPDLNDMIAAVKAAGADLVIVETPGIGQGDAAVVDHVDRSLYVMTPEFGAASQLEKIDMLDHADLVAINKFDRRGGADARRDVARQLLRNREDFGASPEDMPVFGTVASRFNDDGVTALYQELRTLLVPHGLPAHPMTAGLAPVTVRVSSADTAVVPAARSRYLADVADTVRDHHLQVNVQADVARQLQQVRAVRAMLGEQPNGTEVDRLGGLEADLDHRLHPQARALLADWPATIAAYTGTGTEADQSNPAHPTLHKASLSGTPVPRVALPRLHDHGDLLRFLWLENLPGRFPFTAGVFPFKRDNERPARMFAGEGDAFRTNKRFHLLSAGQPATRLSTAFDSVTLYGFDPDERPDIYGKVGNAGVSIATLEDMKVLFEGFDLCDPTTSVSMTINGPAPTILAMFLNTAVDQRLDAFEAIEGRSPTAEEAGEVRSWVLANVRGTVQADILKEDQGQNTCIFSTEFGVDLGLPHRRSRREPDHPAGLHIGQWVHLRGGLPGSGHGRGRLRPKLLVLLLQRHGPRVHRAGTGGPTDLGGGHEGPLRRQRAQPEAQVPRADLGPFPPRPGDGLQRHPHHPPSPHRHLRQLQQPPHQRLRRGGDHPHRRVGAPGPGHPTRDQRCWRSSTGWPHEAVCSGPWRPATSGAGSKTNPTTTRSASTKAPCRSSGSTPSPGPPTPPATAQPRTRWQPMVPPWPWPAPPRRRSVPSSTAWNGSTSTTAPRPPQRLPDCERRHWPERTCSRCSWMPPAAPASARSPTPSSKLEADTAETCEADLGDSLTRWVETSPSGASPASRSA